MDQKSLISPTAVPDFTEFENDTTLLSTLLEFGGLTITVSVT